MRISRYAVRRVVADSRPSRERIVLLNADRLPSASGRILSDAGRLEQGLSRQGGAEVGSPPALQDCSLQKRKHAALQNADSENRRLVTSNTTTTPCAATGLRGFYNMGQACFMSVILQSIIHNPLIRTYYLAEGHRSGDCEKEACTSCALDDIFTDFFGQEKHEGYGAVQMLQACWPLRPCGLASVKICSDVIRRNTCVQCTYHRPWHT